MAVPSAARPKSEPRRGSAPGWVALLLAAAATVTVGSAQAPVEAYPLNRCAPTENGLPVLTRVDVTQRVDVRRAAHRVRIAAKAYDTGGPGARTGLRTVRVGVQVGVADYREVNLRYVGRRWWVRYLTVPRWSSRGTARLTSVALTDRADFPDRSYDDEPLPPDVTYRPGGERRWSQVAGDRTFRVVSVPDRTAPRVTAFRIRPGTVDTRSRRAVVTVSARARDDRSGLSRLRAEFARPEVDDSRPPVTVVLKRVPGHPRQLTGRWTIPRHAGTGDWRLFALLVRDRAGNTRSYGPQEIDRPGWSKVLHVLSEPAPAVAPPTVISVTADTDRVDVHDADRSVTYRLRAVNPVAPLPPGNTRLGLALPQPERSWVTFSLPRLVSGDLHDGVWETVASLDSCIALPGTLTPVVNPEGDATAPPVEVDSGDNTDPTFTAAGSGSRLVVEFSEDVNGISRASLTVLRRRGFDYVRIPGTWSCGAGVDCGTGPVRTATFTPTRTGAVLVRANPDGHLDITDQAGNPAHQSFFVR